MRTLTWKSWRERASIAMPGLVLTLGTLLASAGSVSACPVCDTGTGRQVRAGIFNEDFVPNLLMSSLPFPIFIGAAMALRAWSGRGGAIHPSTTHQGSVKPE
jgi:hypothetical protein